MGCCIGQEKHRDIDCSAVVRSVLVLSLCVVNFIMQYYQILYCNSVNISRENCKWELAEEQPDNDGAVHVLAYSVAYTLLGVVSIWGFFVLAMGCFFFHRQFAIAVGLIWMWIAIMDGMTLARIWDDRNSCHNTNVYAGLTNFSTMDCSDADVCQKRCEDEFDILFFQLLLYSTMTAVICLNTAYDAFYRNDELNNFELSQMRKNNLTKREIIKGRASQAFSSR